MNAFQLKRIEIQVGDWPATERLQLQAEVIGYIAVYRYNGSWSVGEVNSGLWIAGFSARHVARSFACRIAPMLEWGGLFGRIQRSELTQHEKDALDHICQLRLHECFMPNKSEHVAYKGQD